MPLGSAWEARTVPWGVGRTRFQWSGIGSAQPSRHAPIQGSEGEEQRGKDSEQPGNRDHAGEDPNRSPKHAVAQGHRGKPDRHDEDADRDHQHHEQHEGEGAERLVNERPCDPSQRIRDIRGRVPRYGSQKVALARSVAGRRRAAGIVRE